MRGTTRITAALTALATAALLTACTGAAPAPRPTGTASHPTSVVVPSSIPNDVALRKDAAMSSCAAADGGWAAGGTIRNSTGKDHDYQLTVLFTSSQATVIGVGQKTVHVAAGQSEKWKVTGRFAAAKPTLCVLSGVA